MKESQIVPPRGEGQAVVKPQIAARGAPVTGLIRFSYLSADPTEYRQTRNRGLRDRARHLFDPARLARRFELFEAVCLPSLAAQPGDRFAAILLTSEALPATFRDRLDALLAPYPGLTPAYAAPAFCEAAFATHLPQAAAADAVHLTFRLDDDDAIPADYTDRALAYCRPEFAGYALSFYAGYGLGRVRGRLRLWPRRQPMASAGLGFIAAGDKRRTIYDCGDHQSLAERVPTILDGRGPGFLQTAHGGNDSGSRVPWRLRVRPSQAVPVEAVGAAVLAAFPWLAAPALHRL